MIELNGIESFCYEWILNCEYYEVVAASLVLMICWKWNRDDLMIMQNVDYEKRF